MSPWLFALTTRRRELVTETFTSSRTWVAPWGTTRIESMTGEGSDGAAAVFAPEVIDLFFCSLTGLAGGSVVSAASAAAFAEGQAALFGGGGVRNVTYTERNYQINSSDLTTIFDSTASVVVNGAGIVTYGETSGNLTQSNFNSNFARLEIDVQQSAATNGTATTGFGQTFAGGTGAPATPATVTSVAVTRGASYSLVIPSGGSLSLTYYR